MIAQELALLRLSAIGTMLAYGSIRDLMKREVEDWLWPPFLALGGGLLAYEFLFARPGWLLLHVLASLAFAGFLSLFPYYLHLFGGADSKAILTMSLLLPIYSAEFSLLPPTELLHPFTPIAVLTNATLLALILPLVFAIQNGLRLLKGDPIFAGFEHEPRRRRIAALFVGYRCKKVGRFYFPIERLGDDGKRRFDLTLFREGEDFATGNDLWVTPGLPFLVFIFIGFLMMVLFGDLLAIFLRLLLL